MNLPELFRQYLKSQKASPTTTRNYVADINSFFDWLASKTNIRYQIAGKAILGLFTQETIEEYKFNLARENTPFSTINRRLSALRKFGQFVHSRGWIKDNPALKVENILQREADKKKGVKEEIISQFKEHLEKEKISRVTVKNYLSDLRHFLNWLEITT